MAEAGLGPFRSVFRKYTEIVYTSVFTLTVPIKCFIDRDHPVNRNCQTTRCQTTRILRDSIIPK